jgi:hypothetical protein
LRVKKNSTDSKIYKIYVKINAKRDVNWALDEQRKSQPCSSERDKRGVPKDGKDGPHSARKDSATDQAVMNDQCPRMKNLLMEELGSKAELGPDLGSWSES